MEENKPKRSAWARRQEYSKNLSKSLHNPTLSAFKRKRTNVSPLEKNKSEPKSKVNLPILQIDNKKPLDNPLKKPELVPRNKRQILDKTTSKQMLHKPVSVADRPKAIPVSRNATRAAKKPAVNATTNTSSGRRFREVAPKVNSHVQVVKKAVDQKPLSKTKLTINKVELKPTVVKPVNKRPLSASQGNVRNADIPPVKRVRKGSFTISTEKEKNVTKRTIEPRIKTQHMTVIRAQTRVNKAPTGALPKPDVSLGVAKLLPRPDHPLSHIIKPAIRTKENVEQTKNVKKPPVPRLKRAAPKSTLALTEQSLKKCPKLQDDHDAAVATNTAVLKTNAKQNATPLVRLPIRERLALWRERRESLEVESIERRKTLSLLGDILNASRHERCFTPAPTSVYSCPYGTRNEIVNRKSLRQKQKPTQTKSDKAQENKPPTPVILALSCADLDKTEDLMLLKPSIIDQENKPPTPQVTANCSPLCSGQDIEEMLMDLKDSLVNGLHVEDAITKLNKLKGSTSNIEKNAHYWEVKALIAEAKGDPEEAYQIYVAAASNEAEPIEVITEALERYLARLDESQVQTNKRKPATNKKRAVKSEGQPKKRRSFNQQNMFESTLIQYAMQKYSPFVTSLKKALELDSPPLAEYITPVRRSARISKSAKSSGGVGKSEAFLLKPNKALPLDD